eukprot:4789497-Prymnesium_polylepis.3
MTGHSVTARTHWSSPSCLGGRALRFRTSRPSLTARSSAFSSDLESSSVGVARPSTNSPPAAIPNLPLALRTRRTSSCSSAPCTCASSSVQWSQQVSKMRTVLTKQMRLCEARIGNLRDRPEAVFGEDAHQRVTRTLWQLGAVVQTSRLLQLEQVAHIQFLELVALLLRELLA